MDLHSTSFVLIQCVGKPVGEDEIIGRADGFSADPKRPLTLAESWLNDREEPKRENMGNELRLVSHCDAFRGRS